MIYGLFASRVRGPENQTRLNAFVRSERAKMAAVAARETQAAEVAEAASRAAAERAAAAVRASAAALEAERAAARAATVAAAAAKAEREAAAALRLEMERVTARERNAALANTRRRHHRNNVAATVATMGAIRKPQGTMRRSRTPTRPVAAAAAPIAAAAPRGAAYNNYVPSARISRRRFRSLPRAGNRGASIQEGLLRFPNRRLSTVASAPAHAPAPMAATAAATVPVAAVTAAPRSGFRPTHFSITSRNIRSNRTLGPPTHQNLTHLFR